MRSHAGIIIGILAGLLLSAIAGVIFLTRDITYEVDLENPNDKVQVEGLVKKYEMQVGENGEIFEVQNWTMDQDDIEIKVKAPPDFEKYSQLVVEAEFENPDAPTLEVGIKKQVDYLMGEPLYDWEWHFLDNKYLNEFKTYLGKEWSVISDENLGLSLFQKEQKYESVGEFLENPPENPEDEEEKAQIATVDFSLFPQYEIQATERKTTEIPFTFRGNVDFFVFFDPKDSEKIDFSFWKQDRNFYEGPDIYEMRIFDDQEGSLLDYKILQDDGNTKNDLKIDIQKYNLSFLPPKKGVYNIQFRLQESNADAFLRNFSFSSPRVMLNNFMVVDRENFLAENLVTKPMTFFAQNGEVTMSPSHKSSRQKIFINNEEEIMLEEKTSFTVSDGPKSFTTTLNSIGISANSPVALSPDALFSRKEFKTTPFLGNDFQDEYYYVVSHYIAGKTEKSDQAKTALFSTKNIKMENDSFILKIRSKNITAYQGAISFKNIRLLFQK